MVDLWRSSLQENKEIYFFGVRGLLLVEALQRGRMIEAFLKQITPAKIAEPSQIIMVKILNCSYHQYPSTDDDSFIMQYRPKTWPVKNSLKPFYHISSEIFQFSITLLTCFTLEGIPELILHGQNAYLMSESIPNILMQHFGMGGGGFYIKDCFVQEVSFQYQH